MNSFYPIYINLNQQTCLVVGGGHVAERKVQALLDSGARVKVVSPVLTEQLRHWVAAGAVEYIDREYQSHDLPGAFLVISATDREAVNQQVANDCFKQGILVNVVDDPPKCNFYVPSVVRRGALSIAVSTNGRSPLLAAKIRRQLERQFGPEYGEFLELMGEVRREVLSRVADGDERRVIFEELVNSDILTLLKEKKYDQVKERVEHAYCGSGS